MDLFILTELRNKKEYKICIMKKANKISILIVFFGFLLYSSCVAQTDPGYRLYRFNSLILNPAQAGSNDFSDISVLGASYWLGVRGAPKTLTISGNLNLIENFGLGVSVIGDQIGPVQNTSLNFSGSYHLKLNDNWKLSTGLKLSAMQQNVLLSELYTAEQNDPDMIQNLSTGLSYNSGFGFLVYSKRIFIGAVIPRLATINYTRINMANFVDKKGGYIAYSGVNIKISENFEFRPSLVSYFAYGGPLNLDINSTCTFNKKFDLGLSYQLNGSVGVVLGLNINNQFYFGYNYSYPVNKLNTVSLQSHELAIRMMFKKPLVTADSPRFFN